MSTFDRILISLSRADKLGANLIRISIAIVFIWIGLLKFVPFEADSITPMVARSPVMFFFYKHPEQYKEHMTKEGQLVPAARAWQDENNTYRFSRGLGSVELFIALMVLLNPISRRVGLIGGLLSFLTPFVTLSFLVTTPEAWVPALGDAQHGFPYLSGMGRLIIKDTMMLAGAVVVMADCARTLLQERAAGSVSRSARRPQSLPSES
ncbi:reactive chlorine resistance membrane protein RclC [Burkholderia sp. S171]|uniref:reactive chlorine resistance membrane protein RclC n=1 Tax=Burkholderia sp. S171 TaxID=1641860 RepID=UPI00131E06AD|nr:reactive chlorine resistance membrane protein RclC [Burkholderia sp. S171]